MEKVLPKRKSVRLQGYDYSRNGAYFITLCTYSHQHLFGEIIDNKMILNDYGEILYNTYTDLLNHNQNIELDKFVIMPNHMHGIIVITCRERFQTAPESAVVSKTPETIKNNGIPEIIRQLKTFSSRRINEFRKRNGLEPRNGHGPFPTPNTIWQKSYYDHIIRNEAEYRKIWQYIEVNPLKWKLDKYYCD